jgi:hypothetical protein
MCEMRARISMRVDARTDGSLARCVTASPCVFPVSSLSQLRASADVDLHPVQRGDHRPRHESADRHAGGEGRGRIPGEGGRTRRQAGGGGEEEVYGRSTRTRARMSGMSGMSPPLGARPSTRPYEGRARMHAFITAGTRLERRIQCSLSCSIIQSEGYVIRISCYVHGREVVAYAQQQTRARAHKTYTHIQNSKSWPRLLRVCAALELSPSFIVDHDNVSYPYRTVTVFSLNKLRIHERSEKVV